MPILQVGQQWPSVALIYVGVLVVFYLLLMRPQQVQRRKRQEMLGKLKKGDRIVTVGGLHGTVMDVDGDVLTVELAPNLRVKADRSGVSYLRGKKRDEQPAPTPISATPPPT